MDAPAGALPAMRSPDRWLAGLRIAVGVWFAKAIFTKLSVTLAWGFLPVPTASDRWLHIMPILVTKYAEGNPIGFFREFLLNTVVPNSHVYAQLTAFGEAAVGLGLVFGCCTALAAAIGLVRSEEHTSELQSRLHLVCRLLLEKKKKTTVTSQLARDLRLLCRGVAPTTVA